MQPPPQPGSGSLQFIGNATLLIRLGGFTILTDPNFIHAGEQVPLGYGLHATRLLDPALQIAELPPLDFVLLSHFHGDHFDEVAERELDRALPVLTTPDAAEELRSRGFTGPVALATWQATSYEREGSRLTVTSLPGRHGPPVVQFALPEVMGSMLTLETLEGTPLATVYISGDTVMHDALREIRARHGDIDLGVFHLGGTRVMGITVSMDGEQGLELLRVLRPRTVVPVHFDDYDVFKSPLSDFRERVRAEGLANRVRYLERGQSWAFPLRAQEAGERRSA